MIPMLSIIMNGKLGHCYSFIFISIHFYLFRTTGHICYTFYTNIGPAFPHDISYRFVTVTGGGMFFLIKVIYTEFSHDDLIIWKHFPRYWPFVRGIHLSPVNSTHKGQWRGALKVSLICALNKRLDKQSWGWWFETPSRSLLHHCNDKTISGGRFNIK